MISSFLKCVIQNIDTVSYLYYNRYKIIYQMTQEQFKIQLPQDLTISHFSDSLRIKSELSSVQNYQQNNQVRRHLLSIASSQGQAYPTSFVRNFLLIKLNSWTRFSSTTSKQFLNTLTAFFNTLQQSDGQYSFKWSRDDGELIAQIILQCKADSSLPFDEVDELLEGSALIAATALAALEIFRNIMVKSELAVVLGLTSLHCRTQPFIAIVNEEKNHPGQIKFAQRINSLIHLNANIKVKNLQIIQDAYSLRCTPQVHGVLYQCYSQLELQIGGLINRPQSKSLVLNGKKVRNLCVRAETEALMLDGLVCALNQVGHMSFLRAERILNRFIGGSNIAANVHYSFLMASLKKVSYLVNENKLTASPANMDTILLNNYSHDIYVNDGAHYTKVQKMAGNILRIISVELQAAVQVLFENYGTETTLFLNEQMERTYQQMLKLREEDSFSFAGAITKWLSGQN